eukprot:TRINITY_DN39004_c0_g1_i1.p1 TRINITY_DN39004_c0_g1~~TRINITY_DN39004_c0_g1_i1.p1  ORF type:complete len:335 (-),score=112.04 TRINITY_DN39004_c0_g1_i1:93-1037(-)
MASNNLKQPLLNTEPDIEDGIQKPKTPKEPDGPFADGFTKKNVALFVLNPNNIPVLIMAAITLLAAGGLCYYEVTHLFLKLSFCVVCAGMAVIGSGGGTYIVYKSVHLAEQIEEFRLENERMKKQNKEFEDENAAYKAENEKYTKMQASLQENVDKLQAVGDDISSQLDGMKDLRDSLQKYAAEMGGDFKAALKKTNEVFEKVGKVTEENEKTLLFKTVQDLEFMDHKEGMGKREWDRFTKRVPKTYRDSFDRLNLTFDSLAVDGNIPFLKVRDVVSKLVDASDDSQQGAPKKADVKAEVQKQLDAVASKIAGA